MTGQHPSAIAVPQRAGGASRVQVHLQHAQWRPPGIVPIGVGLGTGQRGRGGASGHVPDHRRSEAEHDGGRARWPVDPATQQLEQPQRDARGQRPRDVGPLGTEPVTGTDPGGEDSLRPALVEASRDEVPQPLPRGGHLVSDPGRGDPHEP